MSDEIKCECEECSNLELPEEGISFVLYEKYEKLKQELERVKGERDEAIEVIEFYGDINNWITRDTRIDYLTLAKIINEDDLDDRSDYFTTVHGGKRARQFLAKLNKENKDEQ